jgi:glucose-6-phosphate 1-dehydrogenase
MTQNHLLQILCMLAMEPPDDMQGNRCEVPKSAAELDIRTWSVEEAARMSYRARYTAGEINGQQIPAYVDEDGVDPDNRTETFAKIQLAIDNDRWSGVPFLIRTGKGQAYRRRIANIVFRQLDDGPYRTHMIEPRTRCSSTCCRIACRSVAAQSSRRPASVARSQSEH